jgi:DNA-binding CsgD family transcriptional regulator
VKGLSNKEIADVLGFSLDGAKAHLKTIYSKLGVQDRTAAVSEAIQRGLIRLG